MKLLSILLLLFFISSYAKDITPYRYVTASEAVSDFIKVGDTLIIGTEEGVVDIYDLKEDKLVDKITLPKVKDIWGEYMRPLIFSVDYLDGKLVFVVRVMSGWREFYVYENRKLTKLIDVSQRLTLQEVKFLDKYRVIFATMGNEIMLYNLNSKKFIYKIELNQASFSDFVLTEDKKYIYSADESPSISKIQVESGKIVQKFNKANKRDIFSIDYKSNLLLSGGKDRRVILYETPDKYKMTKGEFFVYAVGLNPKATKAAFVKNEIDDISVIDTKSLKEIYLLKGHKQTILKIDFYKENEIITADEANRLMFWKLE
ncbi:MAG: hypothetical protein J7K14_05200 [Sulfurimonas sp.]|nr:hypothetical protein [Sulfurimonas sp.]